MDDFEAAPLCDIRHGDLIEAVEHLNRALDLLVYVNNQLIDGTVDFLDLTEALSGAWNEINGCRVFTEEYVDFEELLIPAMGLVNDSRLMLESLVYRGIGMTRHGLISILAAIREAITAGIGPGIAQLESCME